MLRNRLHDTLDSPLPLIGIEATVGAGKRTLLDDSNTSLTTDYSYRTIGASQGIDPTWDAGVVLKLIPEKKPQTMPNTGNTVGLTAMIGAVLLVGVGGVLLYVNRIRRTA